MTVPADDPACRSTDSGGDGGSRLLSTDGNGPSPFRLLAVAVVLVGFLAAPAASGAPPAQPATETPNASGTGTRLSGVVAVQDTTVRGVVANETFQARLAAATTDGERASVIDDRLDRLERRLAGASARLETLEGARTNGSVDAGTYTARAAAIWATADRLGAATDATARAADRLPADRRRELNVRVRVDDLRAGVASVRERTRSEAETVDGVGEEIRTRPLSRADVERALGRLSSVGAFGDVAGSERMNVHVRRANGSVMVVPVETQNGTIVAVPAEPFESPTLVVATDYRVVKQVQYADDPAEVAGSALENDRIRYDGRGIGGSLKFGTLKLVSAVGGALLWLVPLVRP